jgi:hypothetical protein
MHHRDQGPCPIDTARQRGQHWSIQVDVFRVVLILKPLKG